MNKLFSSLFVFMLGVIILFPHQAAEAKQFKKLKYKDPTRILVQYTEKQTTPNGNALSTFGIVKLAEGEDLETKVAELKQDPSILQVAPNYKRGMVEITPNDIKLEEQYSVNQEAQANINVGKAWTVTKGKKKTVIAVIDTGVDMNHEDIKGKTWKNGNEVKDNGIDDDGNGFIDDYRGWDFIHDNNNPNPNVCDDKDNGGVTHGTHVAGIAAANTDNEVGIAGVGWKTKIMALQVADCDGTMSDEHIAEAIEYAVMMGADVINLSLGGFGTSSVLEDVIANAQEAGVVVVAAAGNNGRNIDRFDFQPACIDGVITVAATDADDNAASFSNFGSGCVDLAAPGVNIVSSVYQDSEDPEFQTLYDSYSGTSMSTPVVAGVVSLLLSQDASLTPKQVLTVLRDSTTDVGISAEYGTGRIDAVNALLALDSVNEVHIKAFSNADKDKKYPVGTRQSDRTPFFRWVVPRLLNEDISGYYVYFGTNENADPLTQGTFQTSNTLSIEELAKANEKEYFLKVAVKQKNGSIYSKQGKAKYILDTKTSAPTFTALTLSNSKPLLEWTASSDTHVEKYQIMRKLKKDDEFTKIAAVGADIFEYTDTSAEAGKSYTYTIRAKDDIGNKASSAEKEIVL